MKACAVCSVKGGVGKTLISLNIAYNLKKMGLSVGLIDADWDNPNFAQFTNINAQIEVDPKEGFKPYEWNGIQVFSMSLIAGRDKSISLTGDRYWQLMDDVAKRTKWNCDYFVIDMPSGSGDAFKAAIHIFGEHLIGDIIVTQPSMMDASRRILNLHKYFEIPVLGLIENMSYFVCKKHKKPVVYYPFGKSVVDQLAKEFNVEVLGKIPIIPDLYQKIQKGNPILEGDTAIPIEAACKKILEAPEQKPGFLERFKTKLLEGIKTEMEKILAYLIVTLNREIPIGDIKQETGFTEERPVMLRIVDDSMTKEITRVALRVKGDKLVVIKDPKNVDFEIIGSFKTIARMIMGVRKRDGELVPFDPMDAWLNGDIITAGVGYAPKATHAIRTLFGNPELMQKVRQKYGSILQRWI